MFNLAKTYVLSVLFSGLFGFLSASDTQCPYISTPENRMTNNNTLRIMQYNVEWLFLDYYKNMDCPGDGCTWQNETVANTHLGYVSDVINLFNPDIINFCEIEGCDELNAVITQTSSDYKPYLLQGDDTSTGQNVGILTKIDPISDLTRSDEKYAYPVPDSTCGYDGSGTTGVSKHSISLFDFNGMKTALVSLHFIAYPTDVERCAKREAQASIVSGIVDEYSNKGFEIIVIGDFNDYDNDILDENDSKPLSSALSIVKGNTLTNIADMVPKENRGTNWWDKNGDCVSSMDEFTMIDHILVSKGILSRIRNVTIYQGYDEYCGKLNSDHFPVIVDIHVG